MRAMSKRWDAGLGEYVEAPDVDAFLADIVAVCRKHNMTLGHEDSHGAFQVLRGYIGDDFPIMAAHIVGTKKVGR